MCAINGFNFLDESLILKMNKVTRHRGPDGTGIFLDEKVSLGHNRLSIIDLSENANQPMKSNDGRFIITFNGEIYNYLDIRNELGKFYDFKTKSDTEVIVASYAKWGQDCVKRFDGIFSFAIWDREKEELFLARDHNGIKPLYYYLKNNKFIFSSEIKAILEHEVPRTLNLDAFNYYFTTLYVPEPLSMFKDIYKFPQASFGIFKNNELKIEKYWCVKNKKSKFNKEELIKKTREEVKKSVKRQLISDKPLGVYLSGGIDSSSVLYCMSEETNKIDTFSVGFKLNEVGEMKKFNRDFELARNTAKFFNTNHHEVYVSPNDVMEYFEKAMWHMDEPVSNPTIISMLKLSGFAKKKVDVVLGGDGGDELFGGYDRYRLSLISSTYQKVVPNIIRGILNKKEKFHKLNTEEGIERFALFLFQKDAIFNEVINKKYIYKDSLKNYFKERYFSEKIFISFEEEFMNTERMTWLTDESLLRTDKMSMAEGLEARVPFLGKGLIEYAATIPLKYKVNLFDTKIILKEAFKGKLPDFLFNNPKMGWISPGAKWLRDDKIKKAAEEILSPNYYSETKDLFKWEEVRSVFQRHVNKEKYNLTMIWALLSFQIWARKFEIKIK